MDVVEIARCPEHGLHGARTDCHDCGGPVEQVPMVAFADLTATWAVATLHRDPAELDDEEPVPVSHWTTDEAGARSMHDALSRAAADLRTDFRYVLVRRYVSDVETIEAG